MPNKIHIFGIIKLLKVICLIINKLNNKKKKGFLKHKLKNHLFHKNY